jgi:mono/diheme cytochrome c family protein
MRRRGATRSILAAVGAVSVLAVVLASIGLALVVRRGFSTRDEPSWLEVRLARALRSLSVPERAKARRNPLPVSPEVLAEARAHWADHCALCHANNGSGDTPVGRALFPRAPDMRRAPTQGLSDGELYYIIQNGVRLTGMPAWGEPVEDDAGTWGLVAFIRHLPRITAQEEAEMKKLNPRSVHELREQEVEEQFLNEQDEEGSTQ